MGALRDIDYETIAHRLLDDHNARRPFKPFAAERGIHDQNDAYRVQAKYVELRKSQSGARLCGYKIGLTSKKMQEMCGIANPVAGVVLSEGARESPAIVDGSTFGRFGLEFEIAVQIARELPQRSKNTSLDDIRRSVGGVAPAIELVDDRNCEYRTLEALSLIADNAWNAGLVHGAFVDSWPDLPDLEGVAFADSAEIGRGFGRDVLGHPFLALAWLADHLAARDETLRAGDIVMTGSLIPTQFPQQSTQYRYSVASLGDVVCRVEL